MFSGGDFGRLSAYRTFMRDSSQRRGLRCRRGNNEDIGWIRQDDHPEIQEGRTKTLKTNPEQEVKLSIRTSPVSNTDF